MKSKKLLLLILLALLTVSNVFAEDMVVRAIPPSLWTNELYIYSWNGSHNGFNKMNYEDGWYTFILQQGEPFLFVNGDSWGNGQTVDITGVAQDMVCYQIDEKIGSEGKYTVTVVPCDGSFEHTVTLSSNNYDVGELYIEWWNSETGNYVSYSSSETDIPIEVQIPMGTSVYVQACTIEGKDNLYYVGKMTVNGKSADCEFNDDSSCASMEFEVTNNLDIEAEFKAYNYHTVRVSANDYVMGHAYIHYTNSITGDDEWISTDDSGVGAEQQDIELEILDGTEVEIGCNPNQAENGNYSDFYFVNGTVNGEQYDWNAESWGSEYYSLYDYYITLTIDKDYDVACNFAAYKKHTVRVSANDYEHCEVGIDVTDIRGVDFSASSNGIGTECELEIIEGSTVQVYAYIENEDDYYFVGWDDGETESDHSSFVLNSDVTFAAEIKAYQYYTITLASNDYDMGSVSVTDQTDDNKWADSYDSGEAVSLSVREDHRVSIEAYLNEDRGYPEDFYEFRGWSNGVADQYFELSSINADLDLTATFAERLHPVPPSGYTQIGESKLFYAANNGNIDIKGIYNKQYYQSTYNDNGYTAAIKVGDNDAVYVDCLNGTTNNGVTVTTSVQQQGKLARVIYTINNKNNKDVTLSMGVYADVMIGENDAAPIVKRKDAYDNVFGLTMDDGTGAQFCVLFGAGISGVSQVNDYWFGGCCVNNAAGEIVGNYDTSIDYYMEENGSYDSGMGWCWKNRSVAAGETIVLSYLIGVGDVSLEPNSSITLVPDDPDSWNDLSVSHRLFAQGLYESPAGLSATIEYAVEDETEWHTLAENIVSDEFFNASFEVMFDAAKDVHVINFRTIDMLGNIQNLKPAKFQDLKPYSILSGIEDKVYTGNELTQENLVSDLSVDSFQIRYLNNINAGTATMYFEGAFPYTIGRKEYSFVIEPQPILYGIEFTNSSVDYTGAELKPQWHFVNYYYGNLTEDKDYTATWTDNILPGTATLTIEGKGNYTGTFSASFTINRLPFSSDLITLTLPDAEILYDGELHQATATAPEGMGEVLFTYISKKSEQEQEPREPASYDVYMTVSDGQIYYGCDATPVGTFTISQFDESEWAILQTIYDDLIGRGWTNPWDMSKGVAGVSDFAGVTIQQGHVVALDLSENNLNGSFPVSTLYLPYMSELNLAGNRLSGNVENNIEEYAAWLAQQPEDQSDGTVSVYVQKPSTWSEVYIWAWTYDENHHATNLFSSWPGVPMTKQSNGWWSYSGLPAGVNVVFSNAGLQQSVDINFIDHDSWYVLSNKTTVSGDAYAVGNMVSYSWSDIEKGVRTIDISDNDFEGNIGAFASVFPKLATLNAENNHLTDVIPMISNSVLSLNLKNQTILKQRTLDLTEPRSLEELMTVVPTIMLYNHDEQSYIPSGEILIVDDIEEPTWQAGIAVVDDDWSLYSNSDNLFKFSSEDVLHVMNDKYGSRFSMNILFNAGDANFSGTTDVLDLQSDINYIFGTYSQYIPFNFTAANLYQDAIINVQDIIRLTDILLQSGSANQAPRRRLAPQSDNEQAMATLTWKNGELHLFSERPVAAIDMTVTAETDVEWIFPSHTVLTKNNGNDRQAIVYSLAGNTIPEYTDIVIARTNDRNAVTITAMLADEDALEIPVKTETVPSGIATDINNTDAENIRVVVAGGELTIHVTDNTSQSDWTLYDLAGKRVAGGVLEAQTTTISNILPQTTYLLVIRDNNAKTLLTKKIINK